MAVVVDFAQIYVFDDNDVDVSLFLSHFDFDLVVIFMTPMFWQQTRCKKQESNSCT